MKPQLGDTGQVLETFKWQDTTTAWGYERQQKGLCSDHWDNSATREHAATRLVKVMSLLQLCPQRALFGATNLRSPKQGKTTEFQTKQLSGASISSL